MRYVEPTDEHRAMSIGMCMRAGFTDQQIERALKRDRRTADNWSRIAEEGYQFRKTSLVDIAAESLRLDRGKPSYETDEMIRAAVSSGSLVSVFDDTANKVLLAAFEEEPDSTEGWVGGRDIKDFKPGKLIDFAAQAELKPLPRGGTAQHASVSDSYEPMQLIRFACQFAADEQDIIDDDLNVLTDMPQTLGRKSRQLRGDLVYSLLHSNPTMNSDSVALFHNTHGNTATAALDSTAIKAGITAIGNQTAPDGTAANLRVRTIIVPPDLRFTARELLQSSTIVIAGTAGSVTERGTLNSLADELIEVRSDARVGTVGVRDPITGTAYTGLTTNWWLSAAAGRGLHLIYRTGTNRSPQIRTSPLTQGKWGVNFDCAFDIGRAIGNWRGLYYSTGAGG